MGRNQNRRKWRKIIPAVLTAVIIIAVITAFWLGYIKHEGTETRSSQGGMMVDARATGEQREESAPNPLAGRSVYFSGIEDTTSGQYIEWVPGETLGPGEYTLDFLQIPYYPEPSGGYVGLTQGSNQVTLAILD